LNKKITTSQPKSTRRQIYKNGHFSALWITYGQVMTHLNQTQGFRKILIVVL